MRFMTEETFGPAFGIMKVKSDEEAIRLMNDSAFGLTCALWTEDLEAAERIGDQLETGTVYMNRCDFLDPALPWVGVKGDGPRRDAVARRLRTPDPAEELPPQNEDVLEATPPRGLSLPGLTRQSRKTVRQHRKIAR